MRKTLVEGMLVVKNFCRGYTRYDHALGSRVNILTYLFTSPFNLYLMTNDKFVLQNMPRGLRSNGDCGKTPAFVPFRGDSSSSDEDTVSASKGVAWALQSHFDR